MLSAKYIRGEWRRTGKRFQTSNSSGEGNRVPLHCSFSWPVGSQCGALEGGLSPRISRSDSGLHWLDAGCFFLSGLCCLSDPKTSGSVRESFSTKCAGHRGIDHVGSKAADTLLKIEPGGFAAISRWLRSRATIPPDAIRSSHASRRDASHGPDPFSMEIRETQPWLRSLRDRRISVGGIRGWRSRATPG